MVTFRFLLTFVTANRHCERQRSNPEFLRGKKDRIASELTLLAIAVTANSLSCELLLDKGGHEGRHRGGEIIDAPHQMNRSQFRLRLPS
jgi:hypothetical protein